MNNRFCKRCEKLYTPEKKYQRYCNECNMKHRRLNTRISNNILLTKQEIERIREERFINKRR